MADLRRRPRARPAARRAGPRLLRARRALPGNRPHPGQRSAANDEIRPGRPPDPDTARYLTQDPIRLVGGTNFYTYPAPTGFIDPLGLVRTRLTDPPPGSLSDLETRCWYIKQESMIPCQIDRSKSLKQQARQAHKLRNEARIRARLLMEDRQKAIGLYTGTNTGKPEPMLTWTQAIAKAEGKGKTGAEAYAYIMGTAQQSRGSINKNVIGDADCGQILAPIQKKFSCN